MSRSHARSGRGIPSVLVEGLIQVYLNIVHESKAVKAYHRPAVTKFIAAMRAKVAAHSDSLLPDFSSIGLNSAWCLVYSKVISGSRIALEIRTNSDVKTPTAWPLNNSERGSTVEGGGINPVSLFSFSFCKSFCFLIRHYSFSFILLLNLVTCHR